MLWVNVELQNVEGKMRNDGDWSTRQTIRPEQLHSLLQHACRRQSGKLRIVDVESRLLCVLL